MIRIVGNDFTRGGEKIGWIRGNDIFDSDGRKKGYFSEGAGDVFNASGTKVGYLEGNNVRSSSDGKSYDRDEIHRSVRGGSYSDTARAAIYILIGD